MKKKLTAEGVAAVLARHGIGPGHDAAELAAELTQRGWALTVGEEAGGLSVKAARRWRALAIRRRPDAGRWSHHTADHLQAGGRTEAAALAAVLAKALARDEG